MLKSTLISGFVVFAAGSAVGCEATTGEGTAEENVGTATSALTSCPTSTAGPQHSASQALAYLFGNTAAIPTTTQCSALKSDLDILVTALGNGTGVMANGGAWTTCGVPSTLYTFTVSSATAWNSLQNASSDADTCFGAGTGAFVIVDSTTAFGPSTVQLTQTLPLKPGAKVQGFYVGTSAPTTVILWPRYFAVGGASAPVAGQPCSPVSLSAGATTSQSIVQQGLYFMCRPTVYIDPSPAQLTQNLSSGQGSSAAATESGSVPTTVWQWPTSPSTGGPFAGGEHCSPVQLSAGYSTSGSIQKTGAYTKCVCPTGGC